MRSRAALLCFAALVAAGCGSGDPEREASAPAQRHASVGSCRGGVTLRDPAADLQGWAGPRRSRYAPSPPDDLRRFELGSTAEGVCAHFTVAGPLRAGTEIVLGAYGPPTSTPGGASVSHAYGFDVVLRESGSVATFGLDRLDSRSEPRVVRAEIAWSGREARVFVPRSELDRPPANMADRPPFPYRTFSFEARVISRPAADRSRTVDFAPAGHNGIGFVDGRLCPVPCRALR